MSNTNSTGRDAGTGLKATNRSMDRVQASLRRRYRAEKRFRAYGLISVVVGILFLFVLMASILAKGYPAFRQ
ncbi:MAG: DUF3333 domain-containing protein, partial [Chromatiales bacterium]|nr:DUF3333 domain-containing protein [Chromatiales bacterium]